MCHQVRRMSGGYPEELITVAKAATLTSSKTPTGRIPGPRSALSTQTDNPLAVSLPTETLHTSGSKTALHICKNNKTMHEPKTKPPNIAHFASQLEVSGSTQLSLSRKSKSPKVWCTWRLYLHIKDIVLLCHLSEWRCVP